MLAIPVTIEKPTVSPENWIKLEAREVRAWSVEDGFGLEIPRVVGSIDPLLLLVGERRLRRLHAEGAVLRVGAIGSPAGDARFTQNGTSVLQGVPLFVKRGFQASDRSFAPRRPKWEEDPPTCSFSRAWIITSQSHARLIETPT